MSRALLVAVLAALALAAPAAALLPVEPSGSAVGDGRPLKAYASLSPVVHLFGDAVTAQVAVVADTKWIDPARVRVTATFTPYKRYSTASCAVGSGRFLQITWTWKLRCLASNLRAADAAERHAPRLPVPAGEDRLPRARRPSVRDHGRLPAGRDALADQSRHR